MALSLEQLFNEYLSLSDRLRPGYQNSLGKGFGLPLSIGLDNHQARLLSVIYRHVQGTRSAIPDQALMDFLPGYYLIHQSELYDTLRIQNRILHEVPGRRLMPFLSNYSADFISVETETGRVYHVYHDEDTIYWSYQTSELFLQTIIACYRNDVYFLDEDGYLDYDETMETEIARRLNPGLGFWEE